MTRSAARTFALEHSADRAPRHSVQRLVRHHGLTTGCNEMSMWFSLPTAMVLRGRRGANKTRLITGGRNLNSVTAAWQSETSNASNSAPVCRVSSTVEGRVNRNHLCALNRHSGNGVSHVDRITGDEIANHDNKH